jgi:hypothetical protein
MLIPANQLLRLINKVGGVLDVQRHVAITDRDLAYYCQFQAITTSGDPRFPPFHVQIIYNCCENVQADRLEQFRLISQEFGITFDEILSVEHSLERA